MIAIIANKGSNPVAAARRRRSYAKAISLFTSCAQALHGVCRGSAQGVQGLCTMTFLASKRSASAVIMVWRREQW